jgi:endonuclease/exonuclease/phosphatase family metal-dependent hydrolase
MRARVSVRSGRLFVCALFGAVAIAAAGSPASAQTTVTISQPKTQVVYATLRGGTYANTNLSKTLETRAGSDNLTYERRAMLKFDTQNLIPAGTAVTSATLTLTVKQADKGLTRHLAAYQVTNSWTETETTWNVRRTSEKWGSAGGDIATKLSTQTVSDAPGAKVTFDVTSLVKAAVAGQLGSSRYTRILLADVDPPTSLSWRSYYTPDDPNTAVRPTLKVTYGGTVTLPTSGGSGSTLKVLEYNVQHGGVGTDGKYDPNRVANWIVKINPDIVSLVELESKDSYDSGDGVAQYKAMLEQKTGVTWYTLDIQDYGDWTSGGIRNAIFSKRPFVSTYRHEFSTGRDRTVGGVSITVNGRNINFMSTHFDPYDQANRIVEAKELVSYANGFAQDRIILGDFNALPGTTEMNTIGAAYHDAWWDAVAAGTQISASDNPNGYTRRARIDFVWYSKSEAHLTLRSVQVVDTRDANGVMPSDHRPLVATFTVQ